MKRFGNDEILCSNTKIITVQVNNSVLTTDIGDKKFEVNEEVEFTYTTKANDFAGTSVLGKFSVLDADSKDAKNCIKKLEYWDEANNCYREFYGDFGPANTGFPLDDATSKFRVEFNKIGKYNVRVQMVTPEGKKVISENTTAIEVKDTNPPEISEITGNPTDWTNADVKLTVVATDKGSGISEYRMNNGNWQKANELTVTEDGKYTFTVTVTENGEYTFTVKDVAGNESDSMKVNVTKIDKTAPTISTVALDTNKTVTVNATDVGINEILYKIDNGEWQTDNKFTIKDNSIHRLYVKDSLGNENSAATEVRAVSYDNTPPVINSISLNTIEWVSDKVVVTVSATDRGAMGISYKLGEEGTWQASNTFEITENGAYKVYAKDAFGNEVKTPTEIKINNIDKKAPEIVSLTSTTEDWTNKDVTISGTVKDAQSGVTKLQYKTDDGEWNDLSFNKSGKFTITISDECNVTYTFKCVDNVGNESVTYAKNVKIDKTEVAITVNNINEEYSKGQTIISGTVTDNLSGIKLADYDNGNGDKGSLTINKDNEFTFTTNVDKSGEYDYKITVTDNAGNSKVINTKKFKIDSKNPEVKSATAEADNWTKEDVKISGKVSDDYSGVKKVYYKDTNGVEKEAKLKDNTYNITLEKTDYEGNIIIYCEDNAGNISDEKTVGVKMDITPPSVPTITYDRNALAYVAEVLTFGFYRAPVTATITATDNLSLDTIEYVYEGTKAQYDSTPVSETKNLAVEGKDLHNDQITVIIPVEFKGTLKARACDKAGNSSDWTDMASDGKKTITGLVIDEIAPKRTVSFSKARVLDRKTMMDRTDINNEEENLILNEDDDVILYYNEKSVVTITVTEANFYKEDVTVKLIKLIKNGDESESDVVVTWTDKDPKDPKDPTKHTGSFEICEDGDYFVKVTCTDHSGNEMTPYTSPEIRIDNTAPVVEVTYNNNNDNKEVINPVDGRKYYNAEQIAKITVTEHNFRAEDFAAKVTAQNVDNNNVEGFKYYTLDKIDYVKEYKEYFANRDNWYYVTANGTLTNDVTLAVNPDVHIAEVKFTTDANYTFDYEYKDLAHNSAADYVADKFTVDKTAPTEVNISYSQSLVDKILEGITFGFYKPDVTVTVTASDATSGIDRFEWKYTREDNASEKNIENEKDTISEPVTEEDKLNNKENILNKIIYSPDGKAMASFKLSAKEVTELNGGKFTQYRGDITVTAIDRAGNKSDENVDNKRINIVDTITPNVTVTYAPTSTDEKVASRFVNDHNEDVNDFKNATRTYYNGKVTAKITVDEANFFEGVNAENGVIHNVGIKLTKTDNDGTKTTYEYLPEGADPMYGDVKSLCNIIWNTTDDDKHTVSIDYEDDADYVLEIKYTDHSGNKAKISEKYLSDNDDKQTPESCEYEYKSKVVTVDTLPPKIDVKYYNDEDNLLQDSDIVKTIDGREYSKTNRKVKVTVKEHNFRAEDFVAKVTAKDAAGKDVNDVNVNDYEAYAKKADNWVQSGDVWTLDTDGMKFDIDANYTFDYKYEDLAHNSADGADKFTLDRVKPGKLTVKYDGDVKTTIMDKILNVITFGYYNAKVKVTVYADDDVSGVDYFTYSYIKADGVSNVNASLENQKITSVSGVKNGKTFSGTFEIPKEILQNTNQFNGTVKFTAFDQVGNKSDEMADTRRIVVDNIEPTSTVTFNDPVQKVNDVSYYDGAVKASIVINEANFFSEDVKVAVTKDGANFPVRVDWNDNSVDVHTGTFTLEAPENHSGDGDYIINVSYTDRSANVMTPFVSNQLTIDTKDPVITVSDVKNQSANNGETISFTVSVTDVNIALDGFKPVLKAVIKKDNGNNSFTYETISIDLGNATTTTNANGETVYTYYVNNLAIDGFYSLVCTAVDYANHRVSLINSATENGGNATVETMNFSVNREGSVFWIETEHNDKYSDKTFTDELNGAYANDKVAVKLHEINVDKVDENASEKTVFTLNDGSKSKNVELKENENYSKNMIVGTGGWYENIYTLENNNFDHDGVYSLNVITYDKAENSNINTKTESGTISFTLDRTKPVVSANVNSDQRVNDTRFWVEFEVTETNLDAETLVVKLVNNKNEKIETKVEALGNNEYKFPVDSGLNYSIEIAAKDLAGNESEIYKVKNLTVSTNIFVLWYANTYLFWGSIGGVVLLTGAIFLLVFIKKRKKNEDR